METSNGRKFNIKNVFYILILAVVIIIVITIIGGQSSGLRTEVSNFSSTTSSNSKPVAKGKVEIKSEALKTVMNSPAIVGEVINNSDQNASYVKVTGTFYDASGKVVGTNFTYAGDTASTALISGQTAPFQLFPLDRNQIFDHYKLDVTWD